MKRFLDKPLRLDVDIGETSPVSVLESPFGDEVCTTSESSIAGFSLAPIQQFHIITKHLGFIFVPLNCCLSLN